MAATRTVSAKNKKRMARNANAMDTLGGFTIIEVVLVLAIAGLIFLMVFIALPQLQRAQRDTQRRDDMARLESAITQFQTNNNGRLPKDSSYKGGENVNASACNDTNGDACRLVEVYLNGVHSTENSFIDPDGTPYALKIEKLASGTEKTVNSFDNTVYLLTGARCDGGETAKGGAQPRDYAIMYKLEGSGTYCQDSGA